jgi:site-specific DNA-methyltransferase (adenine-specific)
LDEKDLNAVHNADCVEWLNARPEGWADLVFADPPFNIGYQYDVYEDRKAYDDYHAWTKDWMAACTRALTPTGSFWIAIGDEYAAEVRMIGRKLGLTVRNWVIWYYTFGQCTKAKFARSHAHLFYFVRDPKVFTFNDKAVRVFSDRQREYHDKRANPDGKLPDDTWFDSRLCGTFAEREGWHPCQMPTSVLNRIIRACSKPGDIVFDPFTGSGTTAVAAKRLSRRYCGTEFSANYVDNIRERLARTEPIATWPAGGSGEWPDAHVEELQSTYSEAGVPTDLLLDHRHLLDAFANYYNWRLANAAVQGKYAPADIWLKLERLRKEARLPRIKVHAVEETAGEVRSLAKGLFDGP